MPDAIEAGLTEERPAKEQAARLAARAASLPPPPPPVVTMATHKRVCGAVCAARRAN